MPLAALPKAWPHGFVRGLRARGGVDVDLAWQSMQLERLTLCSHADKTVAIRYGGQDFSLRLTGGKPKVLGLKSGRLAVL